MEHGPNVSAGKEFASEYKSRLGIRLFLVYSLLYAGFIVINTFTPKLMGIPVIAGLNLAICYGFGLILAAIAMGLVYNSLCTKEEDRLRNADATEGGAS